MNLISHGVLNGTVYNASDFIIKSFNSHVLNFVITLHEDLNGSSKVCFWENRRASVGKRTFSGRLDLSGDWAARRGFTECLARTVTPRHAPTSCDVRIWDLPHVPEERPGAGGGGCSAMDTVTSSDGRDAAASCRVLQRRPGGWHQVKGGNRTLPAFSPVPATPPLTPRIPYVRFPVSHKTLLLMKADI